jgi:fatty-acyl-CoA synthase
MIRPDVMQGFVNAFADAGFKASAFLPSYGLAEATLAVTIMPPGEGIRVELVEEERLSGSPRDLAPGPLSRDRQLRPARAGHGSGDPRRERRAAGAPPHRQGVVPGLGHALPSAIRNRPMPAWSMAGHRRHGLRQREGYLFIVGRAKDMIIINGKNHWPQDIEWAVEQLPGFHQGDIAAFSVETENGEEAPAVLVHCRVSDPEERVKLRDQIRDKVRSITGMNCVVELVPPRTLPRTSSGKLSRAKAKLYLGRDRALSAGGLIDRSAKQDGAQCRWHRAPFA